MLNEIIDVYILDSDLEEELFEVASYCSAVLCCRTAPLQKAGVVSLIKSKPDDTTLAIGDANFHARILVVGILDKDLKRTTLLTHTRLYGPGQRQECYNSRLFWLTMIDTLWQSFAIFFIPLLAYWKTDIGVSGLGDLWTLAVVITVNLHIAMDVVFWNWIIHLTIWKAIVATVVCVFIIDAVPSLPGYWAIYNMAFIDHKGAGLFWLCLLAVPIISLMPRFVVMVFRQYLCPTDVQLAREAEKFGKLRHWESGETEMSQLASNSPQI